MQGRESHAYLAQVNALASQIHALAAEYDKNPHAVADAVKAAVTLPYEDEKPKPVNLWDLPVFGWAWREDGRDLRA